MFQQALFRRVLFGILKIKNSLCVRWRAVDAYSLQPLQEYACFGRNVSWVVVSRAKARVITSGQRNPELKLGVNERLSGLVGRS